MKKIICMILTAAMLLTAAWGGCESLFVDNRETDKVYPERLNLRAEPSKDGAIIGLYYTGAEVQNLGVQNEEYTKVEIGGMTGYMASQYLITQEEAVRRYGEESNFGAYRAAQINLTGMWCAEQPLLAGMDPQSQPLGTLPSGADVGLVGVLDTWAYIAAPIEGQKTFGYVPLDCLTDVGERKVSVIAGKHADSQTILYDRPNSHAKGIMALKNGTACFNLFGRKEGEWRRVRVGGVAGWIRYTQTDNLYDLGAQSRDAVPYYPLLMQAKKDVLLYSDPDDKAAPYITLGKDMKVEVLAERGDYAYVRTFEGGAGAYDCGDFGYARIGELSLAQVGESIGVAQADNDDVPVLLMKEASEESDVLGAICPGAQVRVIEYTQTDYVHVALGELRGYILKKEIRSISAAGSAPSERIPQRATTLEEITLRAKPSQSAKEGEKVAADTRVYMLATLGDWAFVQAAPKAGLMVGDPDSDHTGFVKLSQLNAPASTTKLMALPNADKVNLRSSASSTDGAIIGKVKIGQRLRVAEYGKSWSLVVTPDDTRGYIMTKYLDFQ